MSFNVKFVTADPMIIKDADIFDLQGKFMCHSVDLSDGGLLPTVFTNKPFEDKPSEYYVISGTALPKGWDWKHPDVSVQYLEEWAIGILDLETGELTLYPEQQRRHQGQHQEVQA